MECREKGGRVAVVLITANQTAGGKYDTQVKGGWCVNMCAWTQAARVPKLFPV